jgi:hypothetical protein
MVCYFSWQDSPVKTFLPSEVIENLTDRNDDQDADGRHSLRVSEEYYKV